MKKRLLTMIATAALAIATHAATDISSLFTNLNFADGTTTGWTVTTKGAATEAVTSYTSASSGYAYYIYQAKKSTGGSTTTLSSGTILSRSISGLPAGTYTITGKIYTSRGSTNSSYFALYGNTSSTSQTSQNSSTALSVSVTISEGDDLEFGVKLTTSLSNSSNSITMYAYDFTVTSSTDLSDDDLAKIAASQPLTASNYFSNLDFEDCTMSSGYATDSEIPGWTLNFDLGFSDLWVYNSSNDLGSIASSISSFDGAILTANAWFSSTGSTISAGVIAEQSSTAKLPAGTYTVSCYGSPQIKGNYYLFISDGTTTKTTSMTTNSSWTASASKYTASITIEEASQITIGVGISSNVTYSEWFALYVDNFAVSYSGSGTADDVEDLEGETEEELDYDDLGFANLDFESCTTSSVRGWTVLGGDTWSDRLGSDSDSDRSVWWATNSDLTEGTQSIFALWLSSTNSLTAGELISQTSQNELAAGLYEVSVDVFHQKGGDIALFASAGETTEALTISATTGAWATPVTQTLQILVEKDSELTIGINIPEAIESTETYLYVDNFAVTLKQTLDEYNLALAAAAYEEALEAATKALEEFEALITENDDKDNETYSKLASSLDEATLDTESEEEELSADDYSTATSTLEELAESIESAIAEYEAALAAAELAAAKSAYEAALTAAKSAVSEYEELVDDTEDETLTSLNSALTAATLSEETELTVSDYTDATTALTTVKTDAEAATAAYKAAQELAAAKAAYEAALASATADVNAFAALMVANNDISTDNLAILTALQTALKDATLSEDEDTELTASDYTTAAAALAEVEADAEKAVAAYQAPTTDDGDEDEEEEKEDDDTTDPDTDPVDPDTDPDTQDEGEGTTGEGDDTTGIDAVSEATTAEVYTLTGQKVAKPTRGLYIINGQKVLVK